MRMLYLTLADVDDRSYGGAIRSRHLRDAMLRVGEVDTLVIHGALRTELDAEWRAGRVKRATYAHEEGSAGQWSERRKVRRWVADVVRAGRYDVIVARYLGLAVYVPLGAWRRLVIDADDLFKSSAPGVPATWRARAALWLRNRAARVALRRAAHVWFVNPADGARLSARPPSSWLPNVVALPDPGRPRPAPEPARILMVGYFHHAPNAQGLAWFLDTVMPALVREFPAAEVHVVGKYRPPLAAALAAHRVQFHGFVEDLAAAYDRAALVIAPIRSGGGTQIKVIDALAHGRPLVASRFAHAGFGGSLQDGVHLRVADAPAEWVAQCAAVLRDPAAAEAMGARAREAVADAGLLHVADTVRRTLIEVAGRAPLAPPATSRLRDTRR